jgi:hypothetical protein
MPAAERIKLRMKIGFHEFEADGPSALVTAQVETWMRAAGLRAAAVEQAAAPGDGAPPAAAAAPDVAVTERPAVRPAPPALFRVDAERQLVILRIQTVGRRRNADAALLLLHGFDTCFHAGDGADIPAVRLRAALVASGHRLRRVDRVLAPAVRAGLVRKGGGHKHETYALTAPGARRAAFLVRHYTPAATITAVQDAAAADAARTAAGSKG